MASVERFEDMEIWQKARKLAFETYRCTQDGKFAKDFAFRDQMRRAAVSILSNIAEGFERSGNREFAHFLYMAKGSAGELRSQLYLALDLNYISETACLDLHERATVIARQISALIKYLNHSGKARQENSKPTTKQPDNLIT